LDTSQSGSYQNETGGWEKAEPKRKGKEKNHSFLRGVNRTEDEREKKGYAFRRGGTTHGVLGGGKRKKKKGGNGSLPHSKHVFGGEDLPHLLKTNGGKKR